VGRGVQPHELVEEGRPVLFEQLLLLMCLLGRERSIGIAGRPHQVRRHGGGKDHAVQA
jgi:hypothetical protein